MKKLILLALLLSSCNQTGTPPSTTSTTVVTAQPPITTADPVVTPSPSPAPSPDPSPTPSPVETLTYLIPNDSFHLCQELLVWVPAQTTLVVEMDGYSYNFASTGVTATFYRGIYAGQTMTVIDPVSLGYDCGPVSCGCTINVGVGVIDSIIDNVQ